MACRLGGAQTAHHPWNPAQMALLLRLLPHASARIQFAKRCLSGRRRSPHGPRPPLAALAQPGSRRSAPMGQPPREPRSASADQVLGPAPRLWRCPARGPAMSMKRVSSLALGILTAVGGFVDMSGIITSAQAGAHYRFALLWTLVPGVIGLVVYADMAGRVVIASGRTLFDVIRDRLGFRLALFPLVATAIVNTLTLVVEIAGMSLALQLATQLPYRVGIVVTALLLTLILWKSSFDALENGSALLGLAMLVSVVALVQLMPPWGEIGRAVVHPTLADVDSLPAYLFAGISLLGGYMTPYQFYFYSSGALEDEWTGEDLLVNRVTSVLGSIFGAGIAFALIVDAGQPIQQALGGWGWALFILGAFAVSMGAGLETALSGAYAVCQYFGWDWGKKGRPRQAPVLHLGYLVMLVLQDRRLARPA